MHCGAVVDLCGFTGRQPRMTPGRSRTVCGDVTGSSAGGAETLAAGDPLLRPGERAAPRASLTHTLNDRQNDL